MLPGRLSPLQFGTKQAVIISIMVTTCINTQKKVWLFVQDLLDLEIGSEIRMSGQIIKILVTVKI